MPSFFGFFLNCSAKETNSREGFFTAFSTPKQKALDSTNEECQRHSTEEILYVDIMSTLKNFCADMSISECDKDKHSCLFSCVYSQQVVVGGGRNSSRGVAEEKQHEKRKMRPMKTLTYNLDPCENE